MLWRSLKSEHPCTSFEEAWSVVTFSSEMNCPLTDSGLKFHWPLLPPSTEYWFLDLEGHIAPEIHRGTERAGHSSHSRPSPEGAALAVVSPRHPRPTSAGTSEASVT